MNIKRAVASGLVAIAVAAVPSTGNTFLLPNFTCDSQCWRVPVDHPSIYHKVLPGETLWGISRQYFGSGNHAERIRADNEINDPNKLQVGHTLIISYE